MKELPALLGAMVRRFNPQKQSIPKNQLPRKGYDSRVTRVTPCSEGLRKTKYSPQGFGEEVTWARSDERPRTPVIRGFTRGCLAHATNAVLLQRHDEAEVAQRTLSHIGGKAAPNFKTPFNRPTDQIHNAHV